MEDFQAAFLQRTADTEILRAAARRTAAIHLGGISIECLLKAIIVSNHRLREWKTDGNNPGHHISNPGHDLQAAIRLVPRLLHRMQKFSVVLTWLEAVQNPGQHYIKVRYEGNDPTEEAFRRWSDAYHKLSAWLQKQATQL